MKKPPVKEEIKKEVRNNGNRVAAEIRNKTATAISNQIMNRARASNKGNNHKEGRRHRDQTNQTNLNKAGNKGSSKDMSLSDDRAAMVLSYIVGQGIPSSRTVSVGAGSDRHRYDTDDKDERGKNDRVEITFTVTK